MSIAYTRTFYIFIPSGCIYSNKEYDHEGSLKLQGWQKQFLSDQAKFPQASKFHKVHMYTAVSLVLTKSSFML